MHATHLSSVACAFLKAVGRHGGYGLTVKPVEQISLMQR